MQWSDIWVPTPARTLRQFAGLWILFLGGLACWQGLVKGNVTAAVILGMLAAVGGLGLVKPSAVRPVYVGAMIVAFPIGWTVSRLLLAVLFYGLFTPIGFLFRLIGRDAMGRRYRPDLPTYWAPKLMPTDSRSYLREF